MLEIYKQRIQIQQKQEESMKANSKQTQGGQPTNNTQSIDSG